MKNEDAADGVPADDVSGAVDHSALTAVGVDLAAGPDETVTATFRGSEMIGIKRTPRNPERCIVVRTDFDRQRAYCSVDQGSNQVEDPFRVNGRITDEDQVAAGSDSAALLTIFAKRIAGVVADEARQRDVEVVRVANSAAGKATAEALREAGFTVIEFGE